MNKFGILILIFLFSFSSLSFAKTVKKHYPNGSLQSVVKYDRNGKRNGRYTTYWANGKVMERGIYKNGRLYGPTQRYSIEGERLDY